LDAILATEWPARPPERANAMSTAEPNIANLPELLRKPIRSVWFRAQGNEHLNESLRIRLVSSGRDEDKWIT
jgi:hypothetical protein